MRENNHYMFVNNFFMATSIDIIYLTIHVRFMMATQYSIA